jgi:peptide/nickel transport system permease protein
MQATEALGLSDRRRMFKHMLPNVVHAIIVQSTLDVGGAIITESVLSFLGMGVVPPTPSWGQMIDVVSDMYNMQHYPWLWIIPGVFILLTVVSINLFGDGLREALDPKLTR